MAKLLLGKEVNASINEEIKAKVETLKAQNITPTLGIIRIGEREDDIAYERGATKRCETLGVAYEKFLLPADAEEEEVLKTIDQVNKSEKIHGVLLFRPLPKHLNEDKIVNALAVEKDVDGITDLSMAGVFMGKDMGYAPCTPSACMKVLDHYGIDCTGKKVVVIGRSLVVGKPAAMMLIKKNATVTVCHTRTVDMPSVVKEADIVVVAAGKAGVIDGSYLREGQIVIDVGINVNEEGKLCGDVNFEEAEKIVEAITPVPRGVGGVTTSILLEHVVNNFIWGVPAMICIVGVGLLLSIRTGFLQIRKFPYAMKVTIGRMLKKREASDGALTPFQAVCTALAATVGTGNIAGVAGAIAIGGPGAVFWMWISALLGMCTKFSEVTLAVHFREKNAEGDLVGGPMYYIKNGLKKQWHWLAYLFAAFGVLTVFGTGNATQVNTITTAIDSALYNYGVVSEQNVSTLNLVIGIILAVLIGLILLGGIKRIGQVAEKLVPFMAVIYIILAIGVVILNYRNIPTVFASIFKGAFSPASVTGGAVGSFFMSMKKGVSRGIFSNEAGLGTGSIAHACADTRKPVKQGFFGIFEVFVDTIVICTLTALVILCSGVPVGYGDAAGAELTILGFTSTYGSWVSIFTAIAMCCFAFSTIIGWGLYGTRCVEFLLGTRANRPFMILYALVAIVGATMELGLMWNIAETFNGLMVIPNLIAVFLLSGVVVRLVKEYFDREGKNV